MISEFRRVLQSALVVPLSLAMMTTACQPQTRSAAKSSSASAPVADAYVTPRDYSLTIHGYNYTDTEIGSFEVAGGGGGNIEVSDSDSGGGKSACCAKVYGALYRTDPIKVKWTRDGDTWCEASVMIEPNIPTKPDYLEVHFFQDGHVEVAISEWPTPPRIKLERLHANSRHRDPNLNANNDIKFARCKRGYN